MTTQQRRPEDLEAAAVSRAADLTITDATDRPLTRLAWLYGLAGASQVPHPVRACAVPIAARARSLDVDELGAAVDYAPRTVRHVLRGLVRNGWLEVLHLAMPPDFVTFQDQNGRPVRLEVSRPVPGSYRIAIGSPAWIGRS